MARCSPPLVGVYGTIYIYIYYVDRRGSGGLPRVRPVFIDVVKGRDPFLLHPFLHAQLWNAPRGLMGRQDSCFRRRLPLVSRCLIEPGCREVLCMLGLYFSRVSGCDRQDIYKFHIKTRSKVPVEGGLLMSIQTQGGGDRPQLAPEHGPSANYGSYTPTARVPNYFDLFQCFYPRERGCSRGRSFCVRQRTCFPSVARILRSLGHQFPPSCFFKPTIQVISHFSRKIYSSLRISAACGQGSYSQ